MKGSGSEFIQEAAGRVRAALGESGSLTVLSGAGVSAESGIPTFRDMGGLWEQHDLSEVATPEGYAANPKLVLDFYNERRRKLHDIQPNPGHVALTRLEEVLGDRFSIITQNIDDLHERAGSRRVLHMHGELLRARCSNPSCGRVSDWPGDIGYDDVCEQCSGPIRPHVVWFGEMPLYLEREIPEALGKAQVFLSIGTSGTVYPAAGFVADVKSAGGLTAEINLEPSENAFLFDLQILGPAGETLPLLVEELVGSEG